MERKGLDYMYLDSITIAFDNLEHSTQDIINFAQQRYPSLKYGTDYRIQPQVNCQSIYAEGIHAAQAFGSVALAHNLRVSTVKLVGEFADRREKGVLFQQGLANLSRFRDKFKSSTRLEPAHFENTFPVTRRWLFGAKTSRWTVDIRDRIVANFTGLYVAYNLRGSKAMEAWSYFYGAKDEAEWQNSAHRAFSATTNTLLAPDFWQVGNSRDIFLVSEKPQRKEKDRDIYIYLAAVSRVLAEEAGKPGAGAASLETWIKFLQEQSVKALQSPRFSDILKA
jgi:hypothetical protein